MSSGPSFSTADLRSHAEAYRRDSAHKHKWALGAKETVTRLGRQPRPRRPSETDYNNKRRVLKGAVAALHGGAKTIHRHDALDGAQACDDSGNSASDYDEGYSPSATDKHVYTFGATGVPTEGTQILNAALAKAVEQYEERETLNLVKSEYDVLGADGEVITPGALKKRKPRTPKLEPTVVPSTLDGDYEFV